MSLNTLDHALRPNFTAALLKGMVDNHSSFHIVAEEHNGTCRLLEDLQNAFVNVKSVLINIHDYKSSLSGLTWEIARQLEFESEKRNLSDIKLHFEKNINTQYRLLFYNFDSILNRIDIDKAYNSDFIGSLNNLRQMPNVRLVIVSSQPGRKYWIHLNGEQQVTLSSFFDGLEEEKMPHFTVEEIRREITRTLPHAPESIHKEVQAGFAQSYKELNDTLRFITANNLLQDQGWRSKYKKHKASEGGGDTPGFSVRLVKIREKALRWNNLLGIGVLITLFAFLVSNWEDIKKIFGEEKRKDTPTEQRNEPSK